MGATIETRTVTIATREHGRLDREGYDYVTVTVELSTYDHGFTALASTSIVADGLLADRPLKASSESTYDVTNYDLKNDYKGLWAWFEDVTNDARVNAMHYADK